jgi:hypothetical protein
MSASQETPIPAIVAPQVLLGNHLKALKLPTFAREYEKVAMGSAQDRADYPRYLLRLCGPFYGTGYYGGGGLGLILIVVLILVLLGKL